MENGSLEDWLYPVITRSDGTHYAPRNLDLKQRLDIAVDVALALEYLHHHCDSPVVHCDLKPSNVLLDNEMVAHVGDFGLAKFLLKSIDSSHANQSSSIGVRGTIGYTPPEYGLGNKASTYGDVYSFGVLLLELFTGMRPTNDMFKGSLGLPHFIETTLHNQVEQVIDQALLKDIEQDEKNTLEALYSILGIGLSCSAELPQERLDMKDVAAKLSSVRNKLQGSSL